MPIDIGGGDGYNGLLTTWLQRVWCGAHVRPSLKQEDTRTASNREKRSSRNYCEDVLAPTHSALSSFNFSMSLCGLRSAYYPILSTVLEAFGEDYLSFHMLEHKSAPLACLNNDKLHRGSSRARRAVAASAPQLPVALREQRKNTSSMLGDCLIVAGTNVSAVLLQTMARPAHGHLDREQMSAQTN